MSPGVRAGTRKAASGRPSSFTDLPDMTISWPFSRQQVLDANGRPYLDLRANFFLGGTSTPLTVYSDPARTVPRTQPVVADATGRFPRVYLPAGLYREQVLGPGGELWFDDGLGEAATGSTDPTQPPDASSYAQTGDVKWRLDGSILPGWARLNGGTLGNAGSGATERANADARAAFVYLWNSFGDGVATVSGGRGISGDSDFAAGKTITLPSMRGAVAAGLDDMGAGPAQRLQTLTSIGLNGGSQQALVGNATGLAIGMSVIAQGVSPGTRIADMDGTSITLSQPATSTGTVIARFSALSDAQLPGQDGGSAVVSLLVKQLPRITPSGSIGAIPPHKHPIGYQRLTVYGGGGNGAVNALGKNDTSTDTALTEEAGGTTPTFTGDAFGGNQAHAVLPPMRLGTFFLKL